METKAARVEETVPVIGKKIRSCPRTEVEDVNDVVEPQHDGFRGDKMEVKKLRGIIVSLSLIVVVLSSVVIYGIIKDNQGTNIHNDDNAANNIVVPDVCTINGTNVTNIIEHNLLVNNESSNFSDLLMHEYLLSFNDDGNNGEVIDYDDYDVDDDGSRRRLLSCGNSATGNYGGSGGGYFQIRHPNNACLNIKSICTRTGSLVDAISVTWTDGTASGAAGGGGGGFSCYTSPTGCIKSAYIRHGSLVDGLLLASSDGHMSPFRGGSGGSRTTLNFGGCLKKIDGRSGSLVDRIRFWW